jgi:hypothetical protein
LTLLRAQLDPEERVRAEAAEGSSFDETVTYALESLTATSGPAVTQPVRETSG